MRPTNIEPLLRHMIGFADQFSDAMISNAGYPPFDVESVEPNKVRVSVAAAGFSPDDLKVELDGRKLRISGERKTQGESRTFIHQGIARRAFSRAFTLAEGWEVEGADHAHGVLTVSLIRNVPEKPEPKRIEISRG